MGLQRSAFRLVVVVAVAGACDGRDHAIQPDGGRTKQDAAAGVAPDVVAVILPDAAAAAGAGGDAMDAASGAASDAGADLPGAPPACDPATGCCDQADCPPKNGKVGSCDTATRACSYACAANMKSCNGACISAGACCIDGDCPGTCQLCGADHACVAAKRIDDPTGRCSGTCDPAGKCKSKQGQRCTSATSDGCLGGAPCVDGYCCNAACAGSCMACDVAGSEGTCTAVPSGPPHGTHTQCAGAGTSCGGACGGRADGACVYPTTKCGAATCSGADKVVGQGTCGAGTCSPSLPEMCANGFACVANACRTTCSTKSDCQQGFFCGTGSCLRLVAVQVTVGQEFTCALLSDGTVRCWGSNANKQLGNDAAGEASVTPVVVQGLSGVVAIDAGAFHVCAVMSDETVRCWGANFAGQLGSGSVGADSSTPAVVPGLTGVLAVSAGRLRACVVLKNKTVECWGKTPLEASAARAPVAGLSDVTAVSVGFDHQCAARQGSVACWGNNQFGQLAADPAVLTGSTTPSDVPGLTAISISAGVRFTCVVTTAHSVLCWGNGTSGNLGNGSPPMSSFVPVAVAGISDANLVVTGANHACEMSAAKQVRCWGSNDTGAIGVDLSTTEFDSPASVVPGIAGVSSLAAEINHTCVVVPDGSVRCWGYNADGELGTTPIVTKPFGTANASTVLAW